MAEIKGFKGIYYDSAKVETDSIIMPPYDIIRDTTKYYERSPYNIVRIDKGNDQPGDSDRDNKYTRAAAFYADWLSKGILTRDSGENYYVYTQEYKLPDGTKKKMTGFFAAVKLEEFEKKIILPHEKTHAGPKQDRLMLMRATGSNTSPILSLYFDKTGEIHSVLASAAAGKPFITAVDDEGNNYAMFRVKNDGLAGMFAAKQLFIADGHHRYETAINYRNEQRAAGKTAGLHDYIMMVLISMEHSGISILPTHRMKKTFDTAALLANPGLKEWFEVAEAGGHAELREILVNNAGSGKKVVGLATKRSAWYFTLKKEKYEGSLAGKEHSPAYYLLDASILHDLILKKIMGLDDKAIIDGLDYTPDIDEAINFAATGRGEASLLLGPATVNEVEKISLNGEVMPQKSTYFLPKLGTGFLINKLSE